MPAATFQVVDEWANYLATKKIDSTTTPTGDAFKVVLVTSAVAPTKAGTTVLSALTTCTNGGEAKSLTHTWAETTGGSGIWRLSIGADQTWTATGAGFTFRYVVLYDDTPAATPTDPVVGFWDYGSDQAVALNETVTLDLDANFAVYTLTVN